MRCRPDLNLLFTGLPFELQAEIFLLCLPHKRYPSLPDTGVEAPSTFLRVCKAWRDLALSIPRLWSSFEITTDASQSLRSINLCSRVMLWMRRSRDVPLSVRLTYEPPSSTACRYFDTAATAVLEALMTSISRWERIEIKVPGATLMPLLASAPHDLVNLKSLTINLQGVWTAHGAVRVQTLGVDWVQLTVLHLTLEADNLLTLDECAEILAEATNLTDCTMNAKAIFQNSSFGNLTLATMYRFDLTVHADADDVATPESSLVFFLNSLDLVRVSELRLHWLTNGSDQSAWSLHQPDFMYFLDQLNPTLEKLHLVCLPLSDTQIIDCLDSVPFITHLELKFSLGQHDPISERLLQALTMPNSSEGCPLIPSLQSLRLQCPGEAWSSMPLVQMIDSRLGTLVEFYSHTMPVSRSPLLLSQRQEKWKSQGLDAIIEYIKM